ncbi:MAG: glycosyltransferase family 2 protein [Brevundimonas sp.]|jgi:succinoglycan biosynthesis protein ExoM|uniref:glycosyltransferase family 2 protein n=1 Tax=Brevundimonas sp. TaxID=1871086 RepID=UPI00391A6165
MVALAVIIPTLRRPDSLQRALLSLVRQQGAPPFEVVVVDNDPDGSARAITDALPVPFPLTYVHAPRPGVATARNAGLAATRAGQIAFLDDDQEAMPSWLGTLCQTHEALGADVTFGAITGAIPDSVTRGRAHLEHFFGRHGPAEPALIDEPYGCGNSLMNRASALSGSAPFDVRMDATGGEDDVLFGTLKAKGCRFGWAPHARVLEHAPAHRATMAYVLKRAFAYGQGPSQDAARRRDMASLIRHMGTGAGQAAVFSIAALASSREQAPARWDKAARGLGKLFWFSIFEPHLYGTAELRRTYRQS